ncbi:hypothetical protein GCM10010411_72490 [Actinomadura fulvescens]|uniref:Peptidase C14 caspase domain-containing protein n=1 Tax=Actinomadura fulvescens TaxID=46160 RepID=A0ABN3QFT7_9ACTN
MAGKRALIIANQHYDDARLSELPSAAADAEQLSAVLSDKAIGGFDVDALVDGGWAETGRRIEAFFRTAKHDDLLLLHLSCHGQKDMRGRLFFAVRDTNLDFPASSGIPSGFINDLIEDCRSKRIVLMLDCCYSGAFAKNMRHRAGPVEMDVTEPFSGRGRVVITSSTSLQFSYEGELRSRRTAEPAVFTATVIKGLRDGAADLNEDGHVSVRELYEYVHDEVTRFHPSQTPTMTVNSAEGTIIIARNPRTVRGPTTGVPAQIWRAITHGEVWERQGALHEVAQMLGSLYPERRDDARKALLTLAGDIDRGVASRAQAVWRDRGFGDLPANAGASASSVRRTVRSFGIDLGTTNSSIAYYDGTEVRLIPNAEGSVITPSVVAFSPSGEPLVGAAAKRQAVTNTDLTVHEVKLKLGTDWVLKRGDLTYSAQEIAALLFRKLRQDAETYLGQEVTAAVLTVPAYFTHAQRHALVEAARLAGIQATRTLNEPTAASLVYEAHRSSEVLTILVFDLGGGTFDISLLEIGDGVCEVKATAGDNHLGGRDGTTASSITW